MKPGILKPFFLLTPFLLAFAGNAQDGQALFQTYCTACHTIGEGKRVGPDLINILDKKSPEWTISFIRSSQKMIRDGDADAIAIYQEYNKVLMPDQPLTENEARAVVDFIDGKSKELAAAGGPATGAAAAPDLLAGTTHENIRNGLLLFTGKQSLVNRGPSCGACHKVKDDRVFTSGTLARELTLTHTTMGSAGVAAILANPPFPVMRAAYQDSPLTDQEVIDLTAYLQSVSEEQLYQHPRDYSRLIGFAGFFAFMVFLGFIYIVYIKRKIYPVNREIFDRQTQTAN